MVFQCLKNRRFCSIFSNKAAAFKMFEAPCLRTGSSYSRMCFQFFLYRILILHCHVVKSGLVLWRQICDLIFLRNWFTKSKNKKKHAIFGNTILYLVTEICGNHSKKFDNPGDFASFILKTYKTYIY